MTIKRLSKQDKEELQAAMLEDFWLFAKTVEPHRMYGDVHRDLCRWLTREDRSDNQLVLLPRDHQKSHLAAVYVSWEITRNPAITIIYVSATLSLAQKQLYDIKNILTSPHYRRFWPEMVNETEGERDKWTLSEINVDHPDRKKEGVRDSTVYCAGITTNTTGLHCNLIIKDDVVVPDNAYTIEGRKKVEAACSQFASIQTTGSRELTVGTRYHPNDHYNTCKEMKEEYFSDEGELIGERNLYEIFEKVVETDGDFLWPRAMREDGKWFGFNLQELARKKAKYVDRTQFYAQYYNNPNDVENQRISSDKFQYFDQNKLEYKNAKWYVHGKKLNVFAAIDFAFSNKFKADFTALVVIGVDFEGYIYVLDMDRFKTKKVEKFFDSIIRMHSKWDFRKLRAEVTIAQAAVVEYLKDRIREQGMSLAVDEHRPTRHEGAKEERIAAILEPRYDNMTMYHPKGGYTPALEDELVASNPKHDDLKDALACAVEISRAPKRSFGEYDEQNMEGVVPLRWSNRFGGIAIH